MQILTIVLFVIIAAALYWRLAHNGRQFEVSSRTIAPAAGVVLVGLAISSAMVFVPFGAAGIITQNGALTSTILQPGLNFKIPFIQGVWEMNTQIRALDVSNSSVFTKDQQNADNDYTVNFSLSDKKLKDIAENFRGDGNDTSISDRLIRPRAEYWLKQIEPQYNAADLLVHRSDVAVALQKDLDRDLEPYGVNIAYVSITNISFGQQYQQASEARAAAEQEYQKEITVLKTKKVIAQQTEAIAAGVARANEDIARSLPADPEHVAAVVQLQTVQLLRDKWNGTLPNALGSNSILSVTGQK